jgi:lambda family phage tail tape measure protein
VELLGKAAKGLAINEQFVENLRKSRERAEQFSSAIATAGKFTDAVSNSAQELGLRFLAVLEPALQLILDLGETFKDIDKTVKKLTDNAYGLAEAIQFIGSAAIAIIPFARGMSLLSKSIGAVLGGLGLFDVGKKILDGDDAQKKLAKSTKEAADAAKIQARANEEFVLSLEKITSEYKNQYELKLQDIAAQTEILGLSDAEQDIRKKILDFRKEEAKQIEILRQKVESSEGLNKQKAQESLDIFKAGQTARTQAFEDTIRAQEEAQRSFDVGFKNSMENYISDATNAARIARDVFQTATKGMEDSITKFVKTGKLSFRSLIADILETILRSQIQAIVAQIFSIGGKVGGGVLGNIGKVLGFANGGMIPTNGPVLVGERGPEIISGAQGRVVTPNNQLGGSMVTYYINAVDAMSFKQLIAQDPQFIYALTEQGRRSVPGTRR